MAYCLVGICIYDRLSLLKHCQTIAHVNFISAFIQVEHTALISLYSKWK